MTSAKQQYDTNKQIEALLANKSNAIIGKELLLKDFTDTEIDLLRQYSGYGGLSKFGNEGRGILDEFYTPDWLAQKMWNLARYYGYKTDTTVLEPSCGTGALIRDSQPPNYTHYNNITAFEINPISYTISKILYPGATIYNQHFETAFLHPPRYTLKTKKTWIKGYPFSLVIGNPPYGVFKNQYSGYFDKKYFPQIELFFIYQSIELLEHGGLLVFLQSSNFLSNGEKYNFIKEKLNDKVQLLDAYRLPQIFAYSEVPTDIMILKKL